MKYENINKFAKRVGRSGRTIYRFYNKNVDLREETKKKGGRRLIPLTHKKYWNTDILFDDNKTLVKDNREAKNLIDYLYKNDNPLAIKFWHMKWSMFVSVDYKYERSKTYCFSAMSALYEELVKKYRNDTVLRMFFVTEPFANRNNGQHNHASLYISNEKLRPVILHDINQFFKYDRVDCSDYTKYKGGLFYMMKQGMQGEDWDILGNHLTKEGIKYEDKGH